MAKKEYDKTLDRLIKILSKLSLNHYPDTKELAVEFNVTVRTIQKDVYQRLSAFPIYRNDNGKLQFIDGFTLDRTMLDSKEMILVSLALSQFHHVNDFNEISSTIVQKLLYPKLFNPFYIKYHHLEDIDTDSKLIEQLKKAIERQQIIIVCFEEKKVTVEPYKIANFDGFWYLFARDIVSERVKTYLLSKIDHIEYTEEKHKVPHHHIEKTLSDTHSAWFEEGEGYEVVIKIYPEIAHYFKQKSFLKSQKIKEELEDGSLIVSFEVTHDEDIDNIIKAWLPHVEVLAPERFRLRIIDELERYLRKLK